MKVAIVVSHPIQHFCPQYVSFSNHPGVDIKVFFGSTLGYKKYHDPNFKQEVSWGNLNLEKFSHKFMNGEQLILPARSIDATTLEAELSQFIPNIVVIYGYIQKLQRRAHRWCVANNVKIAFISDAEFRHQRSKFKEFIKFFFIKRFFFRIDYFLSVGNANECFYKSYGVNDNQIIRMHFPIDVLQYENCYRQHDVLRQSIKEKYGIGKNEIVVSSVGKLVSWKNQDHIIDALQILEKEGIWLHYIILGSGEMLNVYKAKASLLKKSKVYFSGFVDILDLPSYYAATDIYIHPASIEPHSIAISEAVYMGCPVIISNRCGSYGDTDDVQIGKNGYVFEFGNIRQLADAIKVLIHDSDKRKEFSKYSHGIAVQFQTQSHYGIVRDLKRKLNEKC